MGKTRWACHHRGRDHEDDQQHQHDVDERRHVDFVDGAVSAPSAAAALAAALCRAVRHAHRVLPIDSAPALDLLVLLIVFMVAAPMMTVGVPLDLPQSKASPLNSDVKPITISIRRTGEVYLGEVELKDDDIVSQLMQTSKTGTEERVFVRGDKRVDYGRVAQVMAIVTGGGFKNPDAGFAVSKRRGEGSGPAQSHGALLR
jgi:biopolymer transport protein TolR